MAKKIKTNKMVEQRENFEIPTNQEEISLEEVWRITSKSKGSWGKAVEEMREERF